MTREPAYKLDLPHVYSGKVRDIYDAGNNQYLMVTSDRISHFSTSMKSHLISTDLSDFPSSAQVPEIAGRSMLVKKVEMPPIECIVRGYITGSAWKEYKANGTMHGTSLPTNLQESEKLPEPVFTPSTKAEDGLHDENISFTQAADIVGLEIAELAKQKSLELYSQGAEYA